MLTSDTWQRRKLERRLHDATSSTERYVDALVRFHVVVADPKGDIQIEGKPRMRQIGETIERGGWIDTATTPPGLLVDENGVSLHDTPGRDWYLSEDQAKVVFHPATDRPGKLALGGMGAGKTTAGVVWTYLRWLEHIGQYREGGITAPTERRIDVVLAEFRNLFPAQWFRYHSATGVMEMCDGTSLRLVSTHRQSASEGSRLAGLNWSFWFGDELQDQSAEFIQIQARLRSADGGRAKRLGSATAKDESAWRELRDSIESSGWWDVHVMMGPNSPFVFPEHWEAMKRVTSANEYKRLVLAEDLPAELAVYYGWDRKRNLVAIPRIGAVDVTSGVLTHYGSYTRPGSQFTIACGHDPGSIYNTTEIMRLYVVAGVPVWIVVGELQTKQTTARQHAKLLRAKLQDEFALEFVATRQDPIPSAKAAIFCDPHGKGEAQTDYQSVYMAFQAEGLDVFNPAPMTGKIKRAGRVEMVNRLLGGSADSPGGARLVVAMQNGRPVAPRLVEAFESLKKRPGDDNPEGTQRKDENDKTHAPCAAAYCLHPFEQEAMTGNTIALAIAEAKRRR